MAGNAVFPVTGEGGQFLCLLIATSASSLTTVFLGLIIETGDERCRGIIVSLQGRFNFKRELTVTFRGWERNGNLSCLEQEERGMFSSSLLPPRVRTRPCLFTLQVVVNTPFVEVLSRTVSGGNGETEAAVAGATEDGVRSVPVSARGGDTRGQ